MVRRRADRRVAGWRRLTQTYMRAFGASEVVLTLLSLARRSLVVGSMLLRRVGAA